MTFESYPDYKIFNEIIKIRQDWLGIPTWGHPRYEYYPYPQRLCLLSDMNRVYVLREVGDIPKYLEYEHAINKLSGKQQSEQDNSILLMAEWMEQAIKEIVPLYSEKEKVVISLLVYGKDYVGKCLNVMLKTLMTPENLPLLCKEKQVIFNIQTDTATKDILEAADIVDRIKALGAHFDYAVIPEPLMKTIDSASVYWLVGAAATLGIEYARANNAAFHHSYPDIVYSNRYFSELLRLSKLAPCVVAPAHRTDESILLPSLKPYETSESGKECISVPSTDLVALDLNALHMGHFPGLVNNRPGMWAYPQSHNIMWETHQFLHFNCPHLNALWLSPEAVAKVPQRFYISLDSELDFLCEGENYYIPQENDDLYLTEFSNQGKAKVEDLYSDAQNFANYLWKLITNRDNFKFFVRGMKLRINRNIRPIMPNVMEESGCMNEKVYLINTIQSKDPGVGTTLSRPRTHVNRIYGITVKA